jgi:hypothetical protein
LGARRALCSFGDAHSAAFIILIGPERGRAEEILAVGPSEGRRPLSAQCGADVDVPAFGVQYRRLVGQLVNCIKVK